MDVYHFGLSVTGRKITEQSPQRISTLETLPQVTERSEGLKWRDLVNFQKTAEPGKGLSEPLLVRATPHCCSTKGLAGSRCGMPAAAAVDVAGRGCDGARSYFELLQRNERNEQRLL